MQSEDFLTQTGAPSQQLGAVGREMLPGDEVEFASSGEAEAAEAAAAGKAH